MLLKSLRAAIAAIALVASPALAVTLPANPATFKAVMDGQAKGGDVVKLEAGAYPGLTVTNKTFVPPVVIDATLSADKGATRLVQVSRAVFANVDGLVIRGGLWTAGCVTAPCYDAAVRANNVRNFTIDGVLGFGAEKATVGELAVQGDGYALNIIGGANVAVLNSAFSGFRSTVAIQNVDGFRVANTRFARMRSDGLNVAYSRGGLVEANFFDGTRISGEEHPDAIQMWSRPNFRPTSDIIIRGNNILTDSQGIFLGNHTRLQPAGFKTWDGVVLAEPTVLDDGGFDRITVEGNTVSSAYPNGIGLYSVRGAVVRNNLVMTLPNALFESRIVLTGGSVIERCGNVTIRAGRTTATDAACPVANAIDPAELAALRTQLKVSADSLSAAASSAAALQAKIDAAKAALN